MKMLVALVEIALSIVCTFAEQSWAQISAKGCQHRILVLPQSHANDLAETGADDSAVYSQYLIAQYIEQHPAIPVFAESNPKDTDLGLFRRMVPNADEVIDQYRRAFPNGIPKYGSDLTEQQKRKLTDVGAYAVLLLTGQIPIVYSVVSDPQKMKADFQAFKKYRIEHPNEAIPRDPAICRLAIDDRERDALVHINSFFENHPDQRDVYLIFGVIHDFTKHADLFPSECVINISEVKVSRSPHVNCLSNVDVSQEQEPVKAAQ